MIVSLTSHDTQIGCIFGRRVKDKVMTIPYHIGCKTPPLRHVRMALYREYNLGQVPRPKIFDKGKQQGDWGTGKGGIALT